MHDRRLGELEQTIGIGSLTLINHAILAVAKDINVSVHRVPVVNFKGREH